MASHVDTSDFDEAAFKASKVDVSDFLRLHMQDKPHTE